MSTPKAGGMRLLTGTKSGSVGQIIALKGKVSMYVYVCDIIRKVNI